MKDDRPPLRFRVRLRTTLVVVAVVALLLVVVIQQVEIARLRRAIDAYGKQRDQFKEMMLELRDAIERHRW